VANKKRRPKSRSGAQRSGNPAKANQATKGGANRNRAGATKAGKSRSDHAAAQASRREQRARERQRQELKNKLSWVALFGGIALVIGIIVFSVSGVFSSSNNGTADAEAWDLPGLFTDQRFKLADFEGQPVVLNFYASWCTVCEAELPEFKSAVETYGDRVKFVFVDSQDTDSGGKRMARAEGIDGFDVAKDVGPGNRDLFRALGGRGMPITAFYDADGTLRFVSSGGLLNGALVDALTRFGYI